MSYACDTSPSHATRRYCLTHLFNVFINDIHSKIEGTLSKFSDDTKLSGALDTPEGWDAIQRDLDKLEKWACVNLRRFDKEKYKVLHLSWGNSHYQSRLGDEGNEISPAEKDLGVLVDEKPDVSHQCALTAQKASCIQGCSKRSVARRSRKVILPLFSALVRPPPGVLHLALEPSAQEGHGAVGAGPQEATNIMKGMEHLSYEERLRVLGLFSLEKKRLWGDLIAAFQ